MSSTTIWAVLLFGTLGTFLFRYSFLWIADRFALPEAFRQLLKYVPPAVLAALVAPAILNPALETANWHSPHLLAGIAAMFIAYRLRSTLWTLLGGMLVLWGLIYLGL